MHLIKALVFVCLQAKVVKLQRMINILHERYTQEQLDGMPQYQRLMSLYRDDRMDNVALHQQISMQITLLIP